MLPFQPPAFIPSADKDLNSRFKALYHFILELYIPYLFDYFRQVTPLDSIQFNQGLLGVQNGVNTTFTLATGQIRLLQTASGVTTPQAVLMRQGLILNYVASVGMLTATSWTLVVTRTPQQTFTQQVVVGQPPAALDVFQFAVVVLA